MGKKWIAIGSFLAAIAVVAGALGAHALRGQIADRLLESYQTGVFYHTVHALALIAAGILAGLYSSISLKPVFWLFFLGIFFFSGSIYLLSTREIVGWEPSFLGPVTPLGGLLFMAGWLVLGVKMLRHKTE
jgi:uncharacterized membrane protein YgdD (TMEM256/DUF423 family)